MVETCDHYTDTSGCRCCHRTDDHRNIHSPSQNSTKSHTATTKTYSHSRRQRFNRRKKRKIQTEINRQIQTERSQFNKELKDLTFVANKNIKEKFSFIPDLSITAHLNARAILGNTKTNSFFNKVSNLAFHNLTKTQSLPNNAHLLLGLGLKYIPTPKQNINENILATTTSRLERDFGLKVFFADEQDDQASYPQTQLRVKSNWRAPLPPLELDNRLSNFTVAIEKTFHHRPTKPNLSQQQQHLLQEIRNNKNIIIASADKGLGPVGIDTTQYIEWGLKHLRDSTTYTILTEDQALSDAKTLYHDIFQWTIKHRRHLNDDTIKYIRRHLEKTRTDPFGYFYLLVKLHKSPISTRPVCSDCASLPHAIGKWVDQQLQPAVQKQQTYFKNSYALKQELDEMILPPNACLFTYDAVSMYTNINTEDCITRLSTYLTDHETTRRFPHLHPTPLIEAIQLVMHNNRMRFGNVVARQYKGIAMGMSPAPSIASLYVGIYEDEHLNIFPPQFLRYLRRFIDDGFGIWIRHPNKTLDQQHWNNFQTLVNNMGLKWEFTQRSDQVVFMDLTISIRNGKIQTNLYTKPLALHLYIPPSSSHAPGIVTGLIFGHVLRIYQLCSNKKDIENEIHLFFRRLVARGHSLNKILPILTAAETNAQQYLRTSTLRSPKKPIKGVTNQLFFHIPYHPANPSSTVVQKLWRQHVSMPPNQKKLSELTNDMGYPIPISKLTIAYSRAPNLGNLLSYRKLNVSIDMTMVMEDGRYCDTHSSAPHTEPATRTS